MRAERLGGKFAGATPKPLHIVETCQSVEQALLAGPVAVDLGGYVGIKAEDNVFSVKRMAQIIPSPRPECSQTLLAGGMPRRGHDDWRGGAHRRVSPEQPAEFHPLHVREVGVQDDQISLCRPHPFEPHAGVICPQDRITVRTEDAFEGAGGPFLVVDNQYERGAASRQGLGHLSGLCPFLCAGGAQSGFHEACCMTRARNCRMFKSCLDFALLAPQGMYYGAIRPHARVGYAAVPQRDARPPSPAHGRVDYVTA